MKTRIKWIILAVMVAMCSKSSMALADGLDMWSGEFQQSLYEPHKNNCTGASEVFIPMGKNGTGGAYGFCIEKSQRTADYYTNARQTCAGLGKRLPEPVEWVYACENYGGSLNNATDDYEWVGNLVTSQSTPGQYSFQGTAGTVVGNGGCHKGGMGVIADAVLSVQTFTFRCVY